MRNFVAAASILAMSVGSAEASVMLVGESPGNPTGNALGTTIVETFTGYADGSNGFTDAAGLTFTGAGGVESTTTSNYALPAGTTPPYFSTTDSGGAGSETITFANQEYRFGLYWGSIDSYNTLKFYENGALVGTFTGGDVILDAAKFGDQASNLSNVYVNFAGAYNEVVMTTGEAAFEIDNISTGVPESSTWAMMLLGFAGLGLAGYRRGKTARATIAAN